MEQHDTPIERLSTRVGYQDEIGRLRKWLKLIKQHTLNGSVLFLIDMALVGRDPLVSDYKLDHSEEERDRSSAQKERDAESCETTVRPIKQ